MSAHIHINGQVCRTHPQKFNSRIVSTMYYEYLQFKSTWDGQINDNYRRWYKKFVYEVFTNFDISISEIFDKISVQTMNLIKYYSMAFDEQDRLVELNVPLFFESLSRFQIHENVLHFSVVLILNFVARDSKSSS